MKSIPQVVIQTHHSILPPHVRSMILAQLGSDWQYNFFDDADILKFFADNPHQDFPDIADRFSSFQGGPHKADLFRYYYIFVKGGLFIDSDAMVYSPLNLLLADVDFLSVQNKHKDLLYQGILGASKNNPIIYEALLDVYRTDPSLLASDYHLLCRNLHRIVHSATCKGRVVLLHEKRLRHGIDGIFADDGSLIFKHFWKKKEIPAPSVTTSEFVKIYETSYWQTGSGLGSSIENTRDYTQRVRSFLLQNDIHTVTDLGCGDWQSTHLIYNDLANIDYLGIDCVPSVISANRERHPGYKFQYLDFVAHIDAVRDSDVYIVKDVLQHLPLKDVRKFLQTLLTTKRFKFLLIVNYGKQLDAKGALKHYVGRGRGLHSKYAPLRDYGACAWFDYFGGEPKHACIIRGIPQTHWNHYKSNETGAFDASAVFPVHKSPLPLIRLGPQGDGGYVVADTAPYDLLLSCGIANDLRFETAFLARYPTECIAYDGTITSLPANPCPHIKWVKKNISYFDSSNSTTLRDVISGRQDIFLKMDIEGHEFNWIDQASQDDLNRIKQIVIEIHWPFDRYRVEMLKKLTHSHAIVHVHGNNYCDRDIPKHLPSGRTFNGCIEINGSVFPEVVEVTYLRKTDFPEGTLQRVQGEFPTPLDAPCNSRAADLVFTIPL